MVSHMALRWLHLIAAAVWLGGMVTLAVVVVTLRRQGVNREQLRAVARAFARLSWAAMGLLLVTGIAQASLYHLWSHPPLMWKLTAVAATIAVALVHQFTATRLGPRGQRALEVLMLVATLLVFAAAVRL